MTVRERTEEMEHRNLADCAVLAAESQGRKVPEEPCPMRTLFQQDVDRITHAKSFRRLKHKTQVFLKPEGDHYRTRLTHTLEVSRIARTMARALKLNEDLTEAISLGHDLGHTPFGHIGEDVLSKIMPGGFSHNEQSLRTVEVLERDGAGLNLAREVCDGILHHSGQVPARTLEGQLVHMADRIAYLNHDFDDAVRAGILKEGDIPDGVTRLLGSTRSQRIDTLVWDVISCGTGSGKIAMTGEIWDAMDRMRDFMFDRLYRNPVAKAEEAKAADILQWLFDYYMENPGQLPGEIRLAAPVPERAVCDYLAGMTDRFAVARFQEIVIPQGWQRL